jgi:NADH-quinone oxidoreductase subunit N
MSHMLNAFQAYMQVGGGGMLLPEIMLVLFALAVLLTDQMLEPRDRHFSAVMAMLGVMFSWLTLVGLPAFVNNFLQRIPFLRIFASVGMRAIAENGALGFGNSLVIDPFFLFFGAIFLIATALVIILSARYLNIEDENHGEYYALMLFATVGMMFMASGYDLIVQFLGLETMALSFYVLAGFLRRDRRSNEGAVKYLLLGAFSSAILAYGFSILYGIGATLDSNRFEVTLPPRTNLDVIQLAVDARGHTDLLVLLALATVVAGLLFKVAAVPFHQWAPDVYEGAPTPITAYISVASKTASFALLLRLLLTVFWPVRVDWEMLIAGVAIASLTVGNLAAITQTNVKRMLAYSSISHVGYILLGIVAAASSAQGFLTGMKGVAFYLFVYGFMTIGAFAVIIVLQRQGVISDELDDLNGLYRRSPLSALVLLVFMLSLAGIPPLAGFVGKYFILQALIETGHTKLALFGALYIVPALYYYFRIVAHAYLYEPGNAPSPIVTFGQKVAFGVLTFVTIAAGIYPEPFVRLATYSLFFPSGFSGH